MCMNYYNILTDSRQSVPTRDVGRASHELFSSENINIQVRNTHATQLAAFIFSFVRETKCRLRKKVRLLYFFQALVFA